MNERLPEDLFVDAGTFFNNPEVSSALQSRSSGLNVPAVNVSTRASLRKTSTMLNAQASIQTRRRSQRFVAIENDISNGLNEEAVMSPTTSSGVAAKREATRFPSVMFSKATATSALSQKNTSSPLPGPKSTTSSYVSTRRSVKREDEEDSAASRPQNVHVTSTSQVHLPFHRSSVASELYQSATSHMSTSTDDLSALTKAVKALKSSSLAGTKNTAAYEDTLATAGPSASVPLPKPAARITTKQTENVSSLDSLQQRVARITLANTPAALHKKAAVVIASPKIERYSPVGYRAARAATPPLVHTATVSAITPAKEQFQKQSEVYGESHTPLMRSLPATPRAPANTPASPLTKTLAEAQQMRQHYTTNVAINTSEPSPAQIEAALAAKYQFNQEENKKPEAKKQSTTDGLYPSFTIAALSVDILQNLPSEEVLLASPLPTILPSTIENMPPPSTHCDIRTEYDGDDVLMGDATPGADSIAMATTVPRRESLSATSDNNNTIFSNSGSGGVRVSSRFKIEALRQGVTPLRVRQHRASFSPSNAGVNVEIESAKKAVAPPSGDVDHRSLINTSQAVEAVNETAATSHKKATSSSSPTMRDNPLTFQAAPSAATADPAASISATGYNPLVENSPAVSSNSGVSNNPLFAGTPSNPTPPSITTRRPSLGMAAAAGLRTPSTGGASAASEGIKLAEKLHAAAEKLQTPVTSGLHQIGNKNSFSGTYKSISANNSNSINSDEDATFQFKGDVQALLQALDANTPQQEPKPSTPVITGAAAAQQQGALFTAGIPTARALAAASTEERPKPVARRPSSFSPTNTGAAILDLAGFDADGERTAPGQGTPLMVPNNTRTLMVAANPGSNGLSRFSPSSSTGAVAVDLKSAGPSAAEVATLRQLIADLETERADAASLLSGYQGTIAELQDRHSAALVKLQAENAMLKSESERLRCERSQIHSQFEVLYREKYAPLKSEAAALRRGADALRTRLAEEGGKVKRISQLEAELSASQAATAAAQQEAEAFKAKAEAAKEAQHVAEQRAFDSDSRLKELEQKWASKFAAESSKAEQSLAAKTAEVSAWKDKHAAMARQYDDAVHRAHLAQAARERKAAEVARKEEEMITLDVRLREYERVLGQYRAENDKFAATKEKYKAAIAALEKQLAEKEAEKQYFQGLLPRS